jgi:hypothetical protein
MLMGSCSCRIGVLQMDFLEAFTPNDDGSFTPINPAVQPASFDVVIFNLVLSYLPTPHLRFRQALFGAASLKGNPNEPPCRCCEQACRALKANGLLLVTTPDSRPVNIVRDLG